MLETKIKRQSLNLSIANSDSNTEDLKNILFVENQKLTIEL